MEANLKLKKLRNSLGLNQTEFAGALGVSQGTITDIERGRIGVSKNVRNKILTNFGVESGYFDTENEVDKSVFKGENEWVTGGEMEKFFSKSPEMAAIVEKAKRRILELRAKLDKDFKPVKTIEKQRVIIESIIKNLEQDNTSFKKFRHSLKAIHAFEDIFNDLKYSAALNRMVNIEDALRHYDPYLSLADLKSQIEADFIAIKPVLNAFVQLSNAMKAFADRGFDISKLTDIDKEEFSTYMEIIK